MSPLGMIGCGMTQILLGLFAIFMKLDINPIIGYRTKKSMLNEKTWFYANKIFGKILAVCGFINLLMGIYSWYILGVNNNLKMTVLIINSIILLIGIAISVLLTEYRLTKFIAASKFDLINKDISEQSRVLCSQDEVSLWKSIKIGIKTSFKNKVFIRLVLINSVSFLSIAIMTSFLYSNINLTSGMLMFVQQYINSTDIHVINKFLSLSTSYSILLIFTITFTPFVSASYHSHKNITINKNIEEMINIILLSIAGNWLTCSFFIMFFLTIKNSFSIEAIIYLLQPLWLFIAIVTSPLLIVFSVIWGNLLFRILQNSSMILVGIGIYILPFMSLPFLQLFNVITINWKFALASSIVLFMLDFLSFYFWYKIIQKKLYRS